jgi:hypothetical protein
MLIKIYVIVLHKYIPHHTIFGFKSCLEFND